MVKILIALMLFAVLTVQRTPIDWTDLGCEIRTGIAVEESR